MAFRFWHWILTSHPQLALTYALWPLPYICASVRTYVCAWARECMYFDNNLFESFEAYASINFHSNCYQNKSNQRLQTLALTSVWHWKVFGFPDFPDFLGSRPQLWNPSDWKFTYIASFLILLKFEPNGIPNIVEVRWLGMYPYINIYL